MKSTKKLYDVQMRPLLFEHYEASGNRLRFFEEFRFGRKTRADAVLVTEQELVGFEFKSDKDSLERLSRQVKDYERFCDRNYLVVGKKLLEKAPELIPEHWGIYLVFMDDNDEIRLECLKKADENTKRMRLHNQLRLLWRSELIPLMRKYRLGGVTRKNKLDMVRALEHALSKEELKAALMDALIERDYTLYEEA